MNARMSMLKLDQIKEHLRNSIPDYIIRFKANAFFKGLTFNETKCTFVSEVILFCEFLNNKELEWGDFDPPFNKRFTLSNLLQYEMLGQVKIKNNFFSFKQDKNNSLINGYNDKYLSLDNYNK